MYVFLYLMIEKEFTLILILQSSTWGKTIVVNVLWYLRAILVLYALYYLIYGMLGYHILTE